MIGAPDVPTGLGHLVEVDAARWWQDLPHLDVVAPERWSFHGSLARIQGLSGDLVNVLSDQEQVFHGAADHQRDRGLAREKLVGFSQPLVLDFQIPEERVERLSYAEQVGDPVAHVPTAKLGLPRQQRRRVGCVPRAESKQAGEFVLAQTPRPRQLQHELNRSGQPTTGAAECPRTPVRPGLAHPFRRGPGSDPRIAEQPRVFPLSG